MRRGISRGEKYSKKMDWKIWGRISGGMSKGNENIKELGPTPSATSASLQL